MNRFIYSKQKTRKTDAKTDIHKETSINKHATIHTSTHIHTHKQTHTHTHTHTQTQIQINIHLKYFFFVLLDSQFTLPSRHI